MIKPKPSNEITVRGQIEAPEESQALRRIGEGMKPQSMEYCGSIAVHFYRKDTDNNAAFINQVLLDHVVEGIAQRGVKNLTENIMVQYGRKPRGEYIKS